MLKHEMSDFACIGWFMDWHWWVWHDLGMQHEWDDWLKMLTWNWYV